MKAIQLEAAKVPGNTKVVIVTPQFSIKHITLNGHTLMPGSLAPVIDTSQAAP